MIRILHRAISIAPLVLFVGTTPAQLPPAEDGFRVRAVAGPVPGQSALHWVLSAIPTAADVSVTDEPRRTDLIAALDSLRTEGRITVLNPNVQGASLGPRLAKLLGNFQIVGPAQIMTRPTAAQGTMEVMVRVRYARATPPVTSKLVESLDIIVSTAAFLGARTPEDSATRRTASDALGARLSGLPPEHARIRMMVAYSTQDTETLPAPRVERALFDVAVRAYEAARTNRVTPGERAPTTSGAGALPLEEASREVEAAYRLSSTALGPVGWPSPVRARLGPLTQATPLAFSFRVDSVQIVNRADIAVSIQSIAPRDEKAKRKALALAEDDRQLLLAQYGPQVREIEGAVPTFVALRDVAYLLRKAQELHNDVRVVARGRDLVFTGERRWTFYGFRQTLELSYSPESELLLGGHFDGSNLLRADETEVADLQFGNEVRKATATLALDRRSRAKYGAKVQAEYLFDSNQQFGNLRGPRFRAEEWSLRPKVYVGYPSVDPNQPFVRSRVSIVADIGWDYRDVHLATRAEPKPSGLEGATSAIVASVGPRYSYEPRRERGGVGRLGIGLQAASRKSIEALGGDFAYEATRIAGDVELFFGVRQAKDLLVRHRRGIGVSYGAVPLFDLYRLGGTSSVRGLEEGELVGRNIGYEQYEVGVALRQLWSLIRGRGTRDTASTPRPKRALLDPSTTYLTFFYDRGGLRDHSDVGRLLIPRSAAKGYGVLIELSSLNVGGRQASLSIGYGRSPDSVLHPSGTPLVQIAVNR